MNVPWGKDLRTMEEAKIAEHFKVPVIVTHYPTEIMGFYKPPSEDNPEEALCFDALAPEGYCEIIGGSQRSLLVDDMKNRLKADGEVVGYVLKVQIDGSLDFEPVVELLNDLGDVEVPAPSDGDRLRYDSGSGKWKNAKMEYISEFRAYLLGQ